MPLAGSTTGAMRRMLPVEFLARQCVGFQLHRLTGLENAELTFRHVEHGLQRIHVDDAEQVLVDLDQIADLDRALGDHAADRRDDARVGQLQFRALECRALRLHVEHWPDRIRAWRSAAS